MWCHFQVLFWQSSSYRTIIIFRDLYSSSNTIHGIQLVIPTYQSLELSKIKQFVSLVGSNIFKYMGRFQNYLPRLFFTNRLTFSNFMIFLELISLSSFSRPLMNSALWFLKTGLSILIQCTQMQKNPVSRQNVNIILTQVLYNRHILFPSIRSISKTMVKN